MLLFACIAALLICMVSGQFIIQYWFPSIGTVTTETPALTLYIDEVEYTNNTLLDWGTLTRALGENVTYYCNATVKNTGNVALTVHILVIDEPVGVSHAWTPANGTTLNPTESVSSMLELTITTVAPDGTYSMGSYVLTGEQT